MKSAGFWQRPSAWVCGLLLASLAVFSLSMFTCFEGCRFASRPLSGNEKAIVLRALDSWAQSPASEPDTISRLKAMVAHRNLRAMDSCRWSGSAERGTFGYTDERGRILLNPALCFCFQRSLVGSAPHDGDVAITLATLYHESRHLVGQDSESVAYEKEWLFVRSIIPTVGPALGAELSHWEAHMPERIQCLLGPQAAQDIAKRVDSSSGGLQARESCDGDREKL